MGILNLNFFLNCIYGASYYFKHFNKMWMWIYLWSFVIDTLYKSVHTDIFKLHLISLKKKKKKIESSPFKHQIEVIYKHWNFHRKKSKLVKLQNQNIQYYKIKFFLCLKHCIEYYQLVHARAQTWHWWNLLLLCHDFNILF